MRDTSKQKGAITIVLVLLMVTALLAMTTAMVSTSIGEKKIKDNSGYSLQAYLAAESGMEDILVRLKNGWAYSATYALPVGTSSTTVSDLGVIGGSRTVTAAGESEKRIRKVAVNYELTTSESGFHYGAQAGEGGIKMANNCSVNGNIYSNGPLSGQGASIITGTAIVAHPGNYLNNIEIDGDAYADLCQNNSHINGILHSTNFGNCTADGGKLALAQPIAAMDMPVTDAQIADWKNDAQTGGTIGSVNCTYNGQVFTLGAVKINGDLIMEKNNCQLIVTGTIWVTGRISLKSSVIRLSGAYGQTSGIVIADGKVDLQTSSQTRGSGQTGSYLMMISTYTGNSGDPAINIGQSFTGDILFTNNGWINIANSTGIREVTGYGISLTNQSGLTYEVGISSAAFSSGPGAVWKITSWEEVE